MNNDHSQGQALVDRHW